MMIGQGSQEREWIDALKAGRMPHAWLLAGPKGLGKAGFALRAGTFLICDGDKSAASGATTLDIDPKCQSAQQIAHGSHPDFLWLKREVPEAKRPKDGGPGKPEDIAHNISIGQIRALLMRLRMRPTNSRWRAVVVDSIDDLERGAANALLKTLEEPPINTIFLLISHQPGRLLPTIRSRCRLMRFNLIEDEVLRPLLAANIPTAGPEEIETLLAIAKGSVGRAMLYAGADIRATSEALHQIAHGGDRDNALRSDLARAVSTSGANSRMELLLLQANAIAVDHARKAQGQAQGDALLSALDARARIAELAVVAGSASADNATIAFAVGSALSSLAAAR